MVGDIFSPCATNGRDDRPDGWLRFVAFIAVAGLASFRLVDL
jgi:hypothetical protein